MKQQFFFAMLIAIAMISCEPGRFASSRNHPGTIGIITVECRSDQQTRQTVVQLLKLARVMEWKTDQQGGFESIEARYEHLPPGKAEQIESMLVQQTGVTEVRVRWETGVVGVVPQQIPGQSATKWPGQ
jgi:hypothetical protein